MSLKFHEIAEATHRILNPFTAEQMVKLGEICHLRPGMRQLDLACGKAEMLCQWAKHWGLHGVGVDISKVFLAAARLRAMELGVTNQVILLEGDAGQYSAGEQRFDIVSCIGATWIGNGLVGTLKLMLPALKPNGLLLVGEPYWISPPPVEAYQSSGFGRDDFTSLVGTLDRIESIGLELVEMVLADHGAWERYAAAQWWNVREWITNNPDDPDVPALREWISKARRDYLEYRRNYLGWGIFVIKTKLDTA